MFDAQFSMARIVKPFANFEARYQGNSAGFPIGFPGVLDRLAGNNGYDPFLLAALPMPIGARVMIWIPAAIYITESAIQQTAYQYQILWRLRSTGDFVSSFDMNVPRDQTPQYHMRTRDVGVAEDPADPSGTLRYVLPAAMQTIAYEQPEPSTDPSTLANGIIHLRGQLIIPCGNHWVAPLVPPPNPGPPVQGVFGQGVWPFSQEPEEAESGGPNFHPFWFDAEGDDMLILARRVTIGEDTDWDFGGVDRPFSSTYGTDNGTRNPAVSTGIFVFTGSAP